MPISHLNSKITDVISAINNIKALCRATAYLYSLRMKLCLYKAKIIFCLLPLLFKYETIKGSTYNNLHNQCLGKMLIVITTKNT